MYLGKESYEKAGLVGKPYGAKGDRKLRPRWGMPLRSFPLFPRICKLIATMRSRHVRPQKPIDAPWKEGLRQASVCLPTGFRPALILAFQQHINGQ